MWNGAVSLLKIFIHVLYKVETCLSLMILYHYMMALSCWNRKKEQKTEKYNKPLKCIYLGILKLACKHIYLHTYACTHMYQTVTNFCDKWPNLMKKHHKFNKIPCTLMCKATFAWFITEAWCGHILLIFNNATYLLCY